MVFWSIWPINREYCHRHPRKTLPCAETRHITFKLLMIEWSLMLRRPIADTPIMLFIVPEARSKVAINWGILCRSKKYREVWFEMTRKVCPITKVCTSVMWSIATITVATCLMFNCRHMQQVSYNFFLCCTVHIKIQFMLLRHVVCITFQLLSVISVFSWITNNFKKCSSV